MYELGLRHTTGRLTIQLGEKGKLPFDVAAIRTIMFRRTPGGLVRARKQLSETLSTGLKNRIRHVTATRIWLEAEQEWAYHETEAERSDEEPGFLEKITDLEENIGKLPEHINVVTEVTVAMRSLTTNTHSQTKNVSRTGAPASARLHLLNKLAKDLEPHAEKLTLIAIDFELAVQKVDPGARHILSVAKGGSKEAQTEELRRNVRNLLVEVESYVGAVSELKIRLAETGEATRSLRRVNGKTRAAFDRLIKASEQLLKWRKFLEDGS